jgi:hypothetical protein
MPKRSSAQKSFCDVRRAVFAPDGGQCRYQSAHERGKRLHIYLDVALLLCRPHSSRIEISPARPARVWSACRLEDTGQQGDCGTWEPTASSRETNRLWCKAGTDSHTSDTVHIEHTQKNALHTHTAPLSHLLPPTRRARRARKQSPQDG